jgi:hypothetical protein
VPGWFYFGAFFGTRMNSLGDIGLERAARLIEIGWVGVYRVEYVQ